MLPMCPVQTVAYASGRSVCLKPRRSAAFVGSRQSKCLAHDEAKTLRSQAGNTLANSLLHPPTSDSFAPMSVVYLSKTSPFAVQSVVAANHIDPPWKFALAV
jgi:hypothetical protein